MKIRTDFVTNSSSSSFVVSLRAELSDGLVLNFECSEFGGDYSGSDASFTATDKEGKNVYSKMVFPDCGDPDSMPYEVTEIVNLGPGTVDMMGISEAKNVMDLILAIKRPFLGSGHYHYEIFTNGEEEYEFEDESAKDIIDNTLSEFNQMVDDCDRIMEEHIKSVSDVKKVVVTYRFEGRGEFLAGPDEILNQLFGWDDGHQIYETIQQNDAQKAAEILKTMVCFKNIDDESIDEFIALVNNCEYPPNECIIVLSINQDGKLHYAITCLFGDDFDFDDCDSDDFDL